MSAAAKLIKDLSEEKTALVNENILLKREVRDLTRRLLEVQELIRGFSIKDMEDTVASVAADNKNETIRKHR